MELSLEYQHTETAVGVTPPRKMLWYVGPQQQFPQSWAGPQYLCVHLRKAKHFCQYIMASRYFEFYQKKLLVKILEREYIDIKKKSHLLKKKKLKRKRKKETLRNLVLKQT